MSFQESLFRAKLDRLDTSQQSIQTLSQWIIFHEDDISDIVPVWSKMLYAAPHSRRLAFIYLANDVLQNARAGNPEIVTAFKQSVGEALVFYHNDPDCSEADRKRVLRLSGILKDREVFDSEYIDSLTSQMNIDKPKAVIETPVINAPNETEQSITTTSIDLRQIATDNPLIRTYLEHEAESVTDALVCIKAEDSVSDVLDSDTPDNEEISLATSSATEHCLRLQACITRREQLLVLFSAAMEREERLLSQNREELKDYQNKLAEHFGVSSADSASELPATKKPRIE